MCDEDFCPEDYKTEFQNYYCNSLKCLGDFDTTSDALADYILELRKELYIYTDGCKKTVEDIYYDLSRLLNESCT
jgi:hypothetical protein